MTEIDDRQRPAAFSPAARPWIRVPPALGWGLVTGWFNLGLIRATRAQSQYFDGLTPHQPTLPVDDPPVGCGTVRGRGLGDCVARTVPPELRVLAWRLYAGLATLALAPRRGRFARDRRGGRRMWRGASSGATARAVVRAVSRRADGVGLRPVPTRRRGLLADRDGGTAPLAALPAAAAGARNVVVIVLDNVRASSLSLYGHDKPTSPNLERLRTGRRRVYPSALDLLVDVAGACEPVHGALVSRTLVRL